MIRRALRRVFGRRQAPPAGASAPPAGDPPAPPSAPEDEAPPELEVEGPELARWVNEQGREVLLLDVREPYETAMGVLGGSLCIPMNSVPARLGELPRDRTIVVVCAHGVRSFGVAHWLREQGLVDTWSLVGGVGAWVAEGGAWVPRT